MNIPETLIESAINPKDIRPHLCAPYLDVHGRRLIATDGLVAAVVPVMVTADDHAGAVPLEVFKRGRKMKGMDCCENAVTLNGSARLVDGTQLPRPEYDSRSESVASAVDGMLARARESRADRAPDLVIDAEILLSLAEALNRPGAKSKRGLQIWLPRNSDGTADFRSPIYCEPTNGPDGAHGLCMPILR